MQGRGEIGFTIVISQIPGGLFRIAYIMTHGERRFLVNFPNHLQPGRA